MVLQCYVLWYVRTCTTADIDNKVFPISNSILVFVFAFVFGIQGIRNINKNRCDFESSVDTIINAWRIPRMQLSKKLINVQLFKFHSEFNLTGELSQESTAQRVQKWRIESTSRSKLSSYNTEVLDHGLQSVMCLENDTFLVYQRHLLYISERRRRIVAPIYIYSATI